MQITRIKLKNFQAHKKLEVNLSDSPVFTIIGHSDQGKSAILRAIKWVCLNEPAGNEFLRYGTKHVYVEIEIDGRRIRREWKNGKHQYFLDDQRFTAFGRSVPEPIQEFLKMDAVNFQGQHEAPFWFSETAGQVSRNLNRIVRLEQIDRTLSNLSAELREAKTLHSDRKTRMREARKARKSYHFVAKLNSDLVAVQQLAARHAQNKQALSTMEELVSAVESSTVATDRLSETVLALSRVAEIGQKSAEKTTAVDELSATIKSAEKFASQVENATVPDLSGLEKKKQDAKTKLDRANSMKELFRSIMKQDKKTKMLLASVNEAKEAMNEFIDANKGKCPLCGQKMKS